jgi:Fe(3+) dicitrate transport protein
MLLPPTLIALLEGLAAPFTSPLARTWWVGLVWAAALALLLTLRDGPLLPRLRALLSHPSTRLDVQLLLGRQLLGLLRGAGGLGGAWWVATRLVRALDGAVGVPEAPALPQPLLTAAYSLSLFFAWDLSRYLVHLAMHRIPTLWAFHQVHHSAERMTPLTFHRIHPVESVIYAVRGAITTGMVAGVFYWVFRGSAQEWTWAGVPVLGVALNVLTGNLRHSEVWLPFPAAVERWLLSPAQHQLHHSADPAHADRNLGTWLAVWDRLAGTLLVADRPPAAFGLAPGARNHGDDLLSAWFGPLRALAPGPRAAAALALLAPAAEAAEDEPPPRQDDVGIEIIVYDEQGTPRSAGAAQRVGEERLEQFEYDDIERILSEVPGVSTRGEDGFGLRPNIGIRGTSTDRSAKVTLMEDGVLFTPAPYAAPAAYFFPMSTRLVGVEVFKGAAATRYGPTTVAGAINVLTRPVPEGPLALLDVAGGMRGTAKVHGAVGAGRDGRGVLLEGALLRTAGFKELDGGGPTGFLRADLMGKGRIPLSATQAIDLKLGYGHETSHETYLGLATADFEAEPLRRYAASALDEMRWDRSQVELGWSARSADGQVRTRTVAYHHGLRRAWLRFDGFASGVDPHALLLEDPTSGQGAVYMAILRGEEDTTTPEQRLDLATNDRTFHSFGLQSDLRWTAPRRTVGALPFDSVLDVGVRLHGDNVIRDQTSTLYELRGGALQRADAPTTQTTDSLATARALAVHAHEDLRLGRVHVLPGARVEIVQTALEEVGLPTEAPLTRTTPLPGAGALVELLPSLDLFGGVYRGFSPVAPGEPEEVGPELSWNHEAGIRFAEADALLELVGFYNAYTNLTGQCTQSAGCAEEDVGTQFNGGSARVVGLEAAARAVVVLPGAFTLPLDATGALTQAQFLSSFDSAFPQFGEVSRGDFLPYVAPWQGSAHATLVHPRFDLGLGLSARGPQRDQAGVGPYGPQDPPALVLLDAAAHARLSDWLEAYATGTNLTNRADVVSWRPFGARPTAPLQVMLGLKVQRQPRAAGG